MMRIGIDIRPLQSTSRERGIGSYIRGLLGGLSEYAVDCEFTLIVFSGRPLPGNLPPALNYEFAALDPDPKWLRSIEPVRYLRWLNPFHALRRGLRYDIIIKRHWNEYQLAQLVRKLKLDILHLPSVFEPEYFANVSRSFPCPVIQTVHDLIPEVFPELNRDAGWEYHYQRQQGRQSLAAAPGHIVAISESAKADTYRFISEAFGRVDVIPNGIEDNFAKPADSAIENVLLKYGLQRHRYYLTSGGAEWRKNLETVVRAFALIAEMRPDLHIVIPGQVSPADKTRIGKLAISCGAQINQLKFLGYVHVDDLSSLYAGASALIFPSRYEGFGLPILEAMRCECPVVTGRNSSLPEVAGEAALYLHDIENEKELAAIMERLMIDTQLGDSLRARGKSQCKQFSWSRSAEQYNTLYRKLINTKQSVAEAFVQEHRLANRI